MLCCPWVTRLRTSPASLGRDTLAAGTKGTLWGWALQGHSCVGHLGVGALSNLGKGHTGVGHSRDEQGADPARDPGEKKGGV